MTDWNTPFPSSLEGLLGEIEKVEIHDNDVYEVRIELDNGEWRADIKYTDWELEKFVYSVRIGRHGALIDNDTL